MPIWPNTNIFFNEFFFLLEMKEKWKMSVQTERQVLKFQGQCRPDFRFQLDGSVMGWIKNRSEPKWVGTKMVRKQISGSFRSNNVSLIGSFTFV